MLAGGEIRLKPSLSCRCEYILPLPFSKSVNMHAHILLNSFWTFCGLCLETLNLYLDGRNARDVSAINHPEKPDHLNRENDYGVPTAGTQPAPATNGAATQV